MEARLVRVVFVNVDFAELAASTDLDDACAGVNKPLFALSVTFFDDSVEVIHGMRRIFNRHGPGPLVGGQAFLQCELGVFLFSPRPCQQSAIHCFLLQGTIQGQLPGSERLGRTQKFLRFAESNSEQQPSSIRERVFLPR